MKLLRQIAVLGFILFVITSCKKDKLPDTEDEVRTYMFISHTRTASNDSIATQAESIDYSKYDLLLLGGDLAYLTSENESTMSMIDAVFDLANPNTLWALGNHDYSDLNRVSSYTNRPAYYTYHKDGITFLVLDTQDSVSNITGVQKDLFQQVVDTIQVSSHLIVLSHQLIWMEGNPVLEQQVPSISNGPLGSCFYCINPSNFYTEIYDQLVSVQQRGIQVICLGGDIGINAKEFEYKTPEGIFFLASGISYTEQDNKVLLFRNNLDKQDLSWNYKLISEL